MKLALSTATFFKRAYTEDAFALIRECGLSRCEVFFATFSEYTPEFCDILLQKKGDIEVSSVHALTNQFEPDLFNMNPRARADAEGFFSQVLDSGRRLGAEIYTFHGSMRLKKKEYVFDYASVGERFCELMAISNAFGISLALENVHWSLFNEPQFFEKLRPHCRGLKTVLDIKQAMQSGVPYERYLDVMGDTLCNVHICDYDHSGRLCVPGKGIVDYGALFKRLARMSYTGNVVIELYYSDFSSISELKDSIRYLQDVYPFGE